MSRLKVINNDTGESEIKRYYTNVAQNAYPYFDDDEKRRTEVRELAYNSGMVAYLFDNEGELYDQ